MQAAAVPVYRSCSVPARHRTPCLDSSLMAGHPVIIAAQSDADNGNWRSGTANRKRLTTCHGCLDTAGAI